MRTYDPLAELSVTIEGWTLEGRSSAVGPDFERRTTTVRLQGLGEEGLGEDVTYDGAEQLAFQREFADSSLEGRSTLDEFSRRLDRLDLFPRGPSQAASRDYRRWAFESAALDLALRQARRSLPEVLGLRPAPLRFVASFGLGHPPDLGRLRDWLTMYPGLGLKLDAAGDWSDPVLSELVATGAVAVVDFKGAYRGTPVDQAPDAELYARVAHAFPRAWLEDPALTPETESALAAHLERVTWDAPIHSVADIRALEVEPRALNIKPSRFGRLERLLDAYDHCRRRDITMYGGGQFELGAGRDQIQLLAALFHPDAPNDVAPGGYNAPRATHGLPTSPLDPSPASTGFRRSTS